MIGNINEFPGRISHERQLEIGKTFVVWSVPKAEVIARGVVVERDVLYDNGYDRLNIFYMDESGERKRMKLTHWGVWGDSPLGCIIVGGEFEDQLSTLPTLAPPSQ